MRSAPSHIAADLPEALKPALDAMAEMLVRHVVEERTKRLERLRALCDAEVIETGVECGEERF